MPGVDVDAISCGGEYDVVNFVFGQAEVDGGSQHAFGAVGVSDLDEVSEPLFEDFGPSFACGQGFDDEAWGLTGTLCSYLPQTLVEGKRSIIGSQEMEEVCGAGEHAEGGAPAVVGVGGAE